MDWWSWSITIGEILNIFVLVVIAVGGLAVGRSAARSAQARNRQWIVDEYDELVNYRKETGNVASDLGYKAFNEAGLFDMKRLSNLNTPASNILTQDVNQFIITVADDVNANLRKDIRYEESQTSQEWVEEFKSRLRKEYRVKVKEQGLLDRAAQIEQDAFPPR